MSEYRRVYKVDRGRTYDKESLMLYISKRIRRKYRIFFFDTDKGINYRAVIESKHNNDFSIQRYNPVYLSWEKVNDLRNF